MGTDHRLVFTCAIGAGIPRDRQNRNVADRGRWWYDANATIGSVTGWAPAENPRIAVLVKIDRPKDDPFGLNTAIPVYQQVVSELMPYLRMAPNPEIIDPSQIDNQ